MSRSLAFRRTSASLRVVMALALVLACLSIGKPTAVASGKAVVQGRSHSAVAKKADEKKAPKFAAGEVIVRYAPKASVATKRAADKKAGAEQVSKLGRTVPGLSKVKLKKGVSVEEAVTAYNAQPGVLYAEPNYRGTIEAVPDDPQFGSLWGLDNTGQDGGVADADIDAPEVWEKTTGSGDVVVAVVDTGVDYTHPDLADNMWTNPAEIAGNDVDDDNNGYIDDIYGIDTVNADSDPMDDYGHGTHCSGTIGAKGNNALGVAGVNWNVKIMAVKWIGADGWGETSGAVEALEYAHAMGADVTSNSWHVFEYSQALYDTIAAGDTLDVFAAGNDSSNTDSWANWPSVYDLPNILAVGASNRMDERAYFSNYGLKTVDLFAPGEDILSTVPGEGYDVYSGTSMATPHVAGTAALLLAEDPGMSWSTLKLALMGSAEAKPDFDARCISGGRLNADLALGTAALEPGSLTGTVTDMEGVPLEGVSVAVDSVLYDTTGADGTYSIEGIVPGTHAVVASSPDYLTRVVPGVVIDPGGAQTADVALQLAGKIAGTITAVKDGAPLENIQVTAYQMGTEYFEPVASTSTGADGSYLLGQLDTGSYRLEFTDTAGNYVSEYYDNKDVLEHADPVDVTAGLTTAPIDGALEEYGKIAGTVTAYNGAPVSGAFVIAYQQFESWWEPANMAEAAEDGTYVMSGLTTGTYRIQLTDPAGEYAYEYYDDVVSVEKATDVAVTTGQTTEGIDAELGIAGKLAGKVTAAEDGSPLADVFVTVYRNEGGSWNQLMFGWITDEYGTYTFGGLPAGNYKVEFNDWMGGRVPEFYKNKQTLRSATPVTVKAGRTITGINAALDVGGSITGTVTSAATGEPIKGAWTSAYRKMGKSWEWWWDAETGEDGTYDLSGLPTGTYRLEIYDPSGAHAYEFYDNETALERGDNIPVTAGAATEGIDVALNSAATISGTITASADGAPVASGTVAVFRQDANNFRMVGYAESTPEGTYSVGGLPAGTYKTLFLDWEGAYAYEFYENAGTLGSATPLTLGVGVAADGVDAALDPAGQISGTVTSVADGAPIEGAWVTGYANLAGYWEPWFGATTDVDGNYTVGGMRTGTYKAEFFDGWGLYAGEFWNNKLTLKRANSISVTSGELTEGIDAALDPLAAPVVVTGARPGATTWVRGTGPAHSSIGVKDRLMHK